MLRKIREHKVAKVLIGSGLGATVYERIFQQ